VNDALRALAAGLRAPVARWRLALALWLTRLVPVVAVLGAPLFHRAVEDVGRHPDAGRLLAPESDGTGFAWGWTRDFFRDVAPDTPDRVFWLVAFAWLAVAFLAGGIVARLVHGRDHPFLADCGLYFGRFLRLAALVVVLAHVVDYGLNGILAESQALRGAAHHTQDFAVQKTLARGLLDLACLWLLGVVAAYAQIRIVAEERRSSFLALLAAARLFLRRVGPVLLVELGLLALVGAGVLVAWLLPRGLAPGADATGLGIGLFLGAAALASYLRSGIEVGTMEARVRLAAADERPETGREEPPEEPDDDGERLAAAGPETGEIKGI